MTYSARVKAIMATVGDAVDRKAVEESIRAAFPEPKAVGYRVTWEETFQDGWVASGDYFATEVSAKREVARLEQMKSCIRNIGRVTALYEIEGTR